MADSGRDGHSAAATDEMHLHVRNGSARIVCHGSDSSRTSKSFRLHWLKHQIIPVTSQTCLLPQEE